MNWLVLVATLVVSSIAADLESCYQSNTDGWGGDIRSFRTENKDKAECYVACRRLAPTCIAFTFRASDGHCWLKKQGHRDPRTSNGLTFGQMECFNEKTAADKEEDTGKKVKYEVNFVTSNGHRHDSGADSGYWFTVNGVKGVTAEHNCVGKKTRGAAGNCTFEDSADIGEVKGVEIANGYDDTWRFVKMTLSVDGKTLPSYNGYKSVNDWRSVSVTFSADPESCYLDNIDLSGGDIRSYITSTKERAECYEACSRHPKCTAFAMAKRDGRCYLKHDGHRSPSANNNVVSAKMECFREKMDPVPESEYVNVARMENVTVTQSGDRTGGKGYRAVDGNSNTRWDLAGCSYSWSHDLNSWQIKLKKSYNIDHVMIYGMSDKWNNDEGNLDGANLMIGGQICSKISGMKNDSTKGLKFDCNGDASKRRGQVVRLENWNKRLIICEIEINVRKDQLEAEAPTLAPALRAGQEIDEFYNVAWRKAATQTSEAHGGSADKAVDGWTAQNWRGRHGSCTHSQHRGSDVWKVDLGRVYQIDHVRVWGLDNHASSYMAGAMVFVGKNLCGRLIDNKKNGAQTVKCENPELMAGRHVSVAAGATYLSICEVQVMVKKADIEKEPKPVTWPGERVGEFTNVALNHKAVNENHTATQSSTIHNGWARRANDGNRNGHWGYGSVTHTAYHGLQYWEVDLGRVYKIHHITIYGRTDCCSERIQGARVIVGRTQVAKDIPKPEKKEEPIKIDLSEEAVYGRKVRVELLNMYLSLAEVEVWVANGEVLGEEKPTVRPTWENVAARRPTNQSSNWGHYYSDRAVDNFPEKVNFNHQSCTHTNKQPINFWEVDLESDYYIDHIKVLGRNDNDGAAKRINGATIMVDGRTVGGFVYKNQNDPFIFPLNGLKGRVVRIVKMDDYLTLCEVMVMVNHDYVPDESAVEPIQKDVPNLARKAKVSSSTTMYGGDAALVSDGKVESDFFRGSCYFSGPAQNGNWVKLALEKVTKVGSVAVYPRLDYFASEVINGAEVRAGGKLCGVIEYKSGALYYELSCDGATASEITISKLGWLSFCEVVVNEA